MPGCARVGGMPIGNSMLPFGPGKKRSWQGETKREAEQSGVS